MKNLRDCTTVTRMLNLLEDVPKEKALQMIGECKFYVEEVEKELTTMERIKKEVEQNGKKGL